jgi:MerR family transcriptional regulator, mercuric resistance operon regulatory protein
MNGMRSGQVAQAAGVNQQTLRYYERRGLLARPPRTPGGHRLYPAETVLRLRAIKAAQRLGFTLTEVADLLQTGRPGRVQPDPALRQRAALKLTEVQAKIAELSSIENALRAALDAECADLMECVRQPCLPLQLADRPDRPDRPHPAGTVTAPGRGAAGARPGARGARMES